MRRYYSVGDWVYDQETKHQWFFVFEWLALVIGIILFGIYSVVIWYGYESIGEITFTNWLVISIIGTCVSLYVVHRRNLAVTGCKKCSVHVNVRQEISRTPLYDQERLFITEEENNFWEPRYEKVEYQVLRTEKVKFRCKRCGTEWVETQNRWVSDMKFLERRRMR